MNEEKFVLISLEDSKNIGEAISNKTAKKILEYLSKRDEISETKLSEELELPLSTIHYNLEKLKEAGLIKAKLFRWSEKGNKIMLYSLANKLIIISPKKIHSDSNFKDNLKNLLFSIISSFAVLGIIKFFTREKTIDNVVYNEAPTLTASAKDAVEESLATTPQQIQNIQGFNLSQIPPEYYFVLAIILMVIFYLIFNFIRKK